MKHPIEVIEELRNTSGSKDKLAILKDNEFNEDFKKVLFYAYNVGINYYITKLPPRKANLQGNNSLDFAISVLVNDIASRRITGNAARDLLLEVADTLKDEDRECLGLIIKRDIKAGISSKTILKVWPKLIPYYPYMRCCTDDKNITYPAISEMKADGIFSRWIINQGGFSAHTRQGSPLINIPSYVVSELMTMKEGVYEGEILIEKDGEVLERQIGNGIVNASFISGKSEFPSDCKGILQLWDYLSLDNYKRGLDNTPRIDRLKVVEKSTESLTHIKCIPYKIVNNKYQAISDYQEYIQKGLEGTVLKNMKAPYKDGTSQHQVKMKVFKEVELIARSLNPANESSKNKDTFGSIFCESQDGEVQVKVTGIPDDLRKEVFDNWEDLYKDSILTVKSNCLLPPTDKKVYWSLFLPSFIAFRIGEKNIADDLLYIKDVFCYDE